MAAAALLLAPDPVAADHVASPVVRPITFPVAGSVRYGNDFGDPRSGGRTHQGNDLMGAKLTPLVAARAGVVTLARIGGTPTAGNWLVLRDDEGWEYWYIHINNDTPGTDDGAAPRQWVFGPGIDVGARVTAGQHLGFLGDSGNAEATAPHLHFEIHPPSAPSINPYSSLKAAAPAPRVVVPGTPTTTTTTTRPAPAPRVAKPAPKPKRKVVRRTRRRTVVVPPRAVRRRR